MIREFLENHGDYRDDKTFKELTTIKMGGHIKHYVEPYNSTELRNIISYLKNENVPFKVIGNGSNLLCSSKDYEGVVICLKRLDHYEIRNDEVHVEAGVLMPYLSQICAREGLSGLEFASGIPGTVGGLLYMNAGAYKKAMVDIVKEAVVLRDDRFVVLRNDELDYSYRHSIFQAHPDWLIVSCILNLSHFDKDKIKALMKERFERRTQSQPLNKPSAGSCFRNPDNDFAWKLIDGIGYRGYKIGGVQVSEKHSNFIINNKDGSPEDFVTLVKDIQNKVKAKYDIELISEVEWFNFE